MALIFVYGTLKRAHGNYRLLRTSKFIGEGVTVSDNWKMYDGGFPMVTSGGKFHVKGELFEVDDAKVLNNLDALEGHPDFFRRTPVTIRVGADEFDAEMYTVGDNYRRSTMVNPNDNNVVEWR